MSQPASRTRWRSLDTDEVLRLMEQWFENHKNEPDFERYTPFRGFDGVLGADLTEIDLSQDTVRQRAEEWAEKNEGKNPPWVSWLGNDGINLSGAIISRNEDGQRVNLSRAQLQGAQLAGAQLQGAQLGGAQLQGARLESAQLQGAWLASAQLQGARLYGAQLQGAFLYGAELKEARLENVDWSEGYVLGNERMANDFGRSLAYQEAEAEYRSLKLWYTNNGQYDIAGEFHFREMIMRRKRFWLTKASARKQYAQHKAESAVLLLFQVVAGFGEMPSRALEWALACVLGFSLAYFNYSPVDVTTWKAWGTFFDRLWKALYFSTVSFTNLGYGSWVETDGIAPEGWTHNLGALESIFGLFLITLFLVTFVRKVSRS